MRKFCIKLLFFLLPVVMLAYPLDLLLSWLLKGSHSMQGEIEVMNDIYAGKVNSDILIYGSSRAWVQFDPNIIDDKLNSNTYNMGVDGHTFQLQYLRHLEYLKYNPVPSLILLSLDIFSLEDSKSAYNFDAYLPYMLWNDNIIKFTKGYDRFDFFDYNIPLVRYFGGKKIWPEMMKILFSKENETTRVKGFASVDREWSDDFDNAKSLRDSIELRVNAETGNLLEKFIEECKRNNIKLVFVYSPEYIEGQTFVSNRKEIIDTYSRIAYKEGIPFWDYSNDCICLRKDFFYNVTHLNKRGSVSFSQKIADRLEREWNTIFASASK